MQQELDNLRLLAERRDLLSNPIGLLRELNQIQARILAKLPQPNNLRAEMQSPPHTVRVQVPPPAQRPITSSATKPSVARSHAKNPVMTANDSVPPTSSPHPYHAIQDSLRQRDLDLGADNIPDLNEQLRDANALSLSENLSRAMAGNLLELMSLNERFLLSNSLFCGDMQALHNLLDKLNLVSDCAAAKQILAQAQQYYGWGEEQSEALELFQQLLDKRFA